MKNEKFSIGVKALFRNKDGQILVLKFTEPKFLSEHKETRWSEDVWDLPGGRIQTDESVEQALVREVSEELHIGTDGFKIGKIFDASIGNLRFVQDGSRLMLISILCDLENHDFKLSEEHSEYKWTSVDEAKKLLAKKFNKTFIKKLDDLK